MELKPSGPATLSELAQWADVLYNVREQRLELERGIAKLQERETELKTAMIAEMRAAGVRVAGGRTCTLKWETKNTPRGRDWGQIYDYVSENNAFDCLYRRLNVQAILDRVEQGEQIPGLEWYPVDSISYSKGK